jgi:hypothetical protein
MGRIDHPKLEFNKVSATDRDWGDRANKTGGMRE